MSKPVSRRTLLATAGAGAMTAAVGASSVSPASAAEPADGLPVVEVDVAVIGAGLTGLSAARKLKAAGRSVHVIEADERVGGRVWTVKATDGTPLNWGATFVGPTQTKVLALAQELGIATYKTFNTGQNVQAFNGGIRKYKGTIPQVDVVSLLELQNVMSRLNGYASSIDTSKPWAADRAERWDSQTLYSWIRDNVNSTAAQKLLDLACLSLFSVESRDVSFLHMLFYIRSAGDLNALLNTGGGAQERQLSGGSQTLPEGLAAKLGAGAITLGSPVRRVVTTDGGLTTVHAEKVTVKARRVLIAVPPPMIPRIIFEPGLSALKDQHLQRLPMGSVGKAIAVYDTPFWRAKGLTGQATSDRGPVKITFDLSPATNTPGVIMGFIDGQDARDWWPKPEAERRQLVLDQFKAWFGAEAGSPREFYDLSWDALPLHRGCPVAVPPPGATVGFQDAWYRTEGPLHFASTETATKWSGYMDGAIQAGESAAADIHGVL